MKNLTAAFPSKARPALFIGLFVAIGVVTLFIARAATSTSAYEPENGTLANGAVVVNDAGASNGKAIKFGAATSTPSWHWYMSGIDGGGFGQVVATDPFHANYATLGGDSWGVYNTTNAGNYWSPATKGIGNVNANDVPNGDFFFMGIAYSHKFPGRVYALTGKLENPGAGNFGYVSGDSYTILTRAINGGESTATCGTRQEHPRCTGNRVIADYDSGSGIEYLYVATGNAGGVKRSTDDGKTWTTIGMGGINSGITGMALDPTDNTTLYAGTESSGSYRISGIRSGSPTTTALAGSPSRVEEMAGIGNSVYVAAHTSGVYKLSNNGNTWTRLGASFFDANTPWSAVGGAGNTIYVGGANTTAGHSIGKSTDGGATWTWLPSSQSKVSNVVWGTTGQWWLGASFPRVLFGCYNGCTYESTSIAVDQFNPNIVYSAGRSGIWKSEDGGNTWAPAVNGLGGTMHNVIQVGSGGNSNVDDVDWTNISTTDNWSTAVQGGTAPTGSGSTTITKNGHTYTVKLTVPRDITVDGTSVADEYFKAAVVRPSDIGVSDDGKYIYIAQYGGGVVVGHYQ